MKSKTGHAMRNAFLRVILLRQNLSRMCASFGLRRVSSRRVEEGIEIGVVTGVQPRSLVSDHVPLLGERDSDDPPLLSASATSDWNAYLGVSRYVVNSAHMAVNISKGNEDPMERVLRAGLHQLWTASAKIYCRGRTFGYSFVCGTCW